MANVSFVKTVKIFYLRNGLVDIHPACQWVHLKILRLFTGHGVHDGRIGAKVIIVSCHPQETGPNHCVLTKKICYRREKSVAYFHSGKNMSNVESTVLATTLLLLSGLSDRKVYHSVP